MVACIIASVETTLHRALQPASCVIDHIYYCMLVVHNIIVLCVISHNVLLQIWPVLVVQLRKNETYQRENIRGWSALDSVPRRYYVVRTCNIVICFAETGGKAHNFCKILATTILAQWATSSMWDEMRDERDQYRQTVVFVLAFDMYETLCPKLGVESYWMAEPLVQIVCSCEFYIELMYTHSSHLRIISILQS